MKQIIAIGAALLLAVPAGAQVPAVSASATAAPSAAAMRIATQLASQQVVLAQTRRVLHEQLPAALRANPDMQTMERQWPGMMNEFIGTMEPIIITSLTRRLPDYQRAVAAIFDRHMTPAELTATGDFYASPTGRHLLVLIQNGVDFTAMLNQQLNSGGNAPISGADLTNAVRPAVAPAVTGLTREEQGVLLQFGTTSAGQKMNTINRELIDLAVRFNNDRDPQSEREIEQAVSKLIQQHRAGTGGK